MAAQDALVTLDDTTVVRRQFAHQLVHQPRFADPGIPLNAYHLRVTLTCEAPTLAQCPNLIITSCQWRQTRRLGRLEAADPWNGAVKSPNPLRSKSLKVSISQIDEREGIPTKSSCRVPNDNVTWAAKLLNPAGQVHNIAKHMQFEHGHCTGCDTDAAADIQPRGNWYFRHSLAYLDCHPQCLIGVILVPHLEAETNTNAISFLLRNYLIMPGSDFSTDIQILCEKGCVALIAKLMS